MSQVAVDSMQVASALSMLACFAIIVVILRLRLRRLLFLRLIFYIAISDFGSAMAMVIGGTRTGSAACYYQGIVNNYFTLASIFWTMVLAYEVHLVIWYQKVQTDLRIFNVIIWTLPFILSLTPLSTSTYGNDDATPGWCFLNEKPGYSDTLDLFWFIMSFYLWVYLAIFYQLYVALLTAYKLYYLQRGMATDVHVVVEKIIFYPMIVIVCWVVSSVVDIGSIFGYDIAVDADNPVSIIFTYVLPNLQGFFSGLVFFSLNYHVIEEFYEEVCKEGLFVKDICCWCLFTKDEVPLNRPTKPSISRHSDHNDLIPDKEDSIASFASSIDQSKRKSEGGPISRSTFSSTTELNLLEHVHVKTNRMTHTTPNESSITQNRSFIGKDAPLEGNGRSEHTNGNSLGNNNGLFRSSKNSLIDSNNQVTTGIISKRPFAPISISKTRASNQNGSASNRFILSAPTKDPPKLDSTTPVLISNNNDNRSSTDSKYNASTRSSDIEMNPRPPSASSMSYSHRRTLDYGGWDEGEDDDSFSNSNAGIGESSSSGSSRGSTSDSVSSVNSRDKRRGSGKRLSLSKGRPSLLQAIEEERESQASRMYSMDQGMPTNTILSTIGGNTVNPMYSNHV